MSAPGFLPVRQLVLVDLLSMMLATRPGELAVVAVDGPGRSGRPALAAELVALAPHVAGRPVRLVGAGGLDDAALHALRDGPAGDELVVVEGERLRRPELRGAWDATCVVMGAPAPPEAGEEAYLLRARTWAPTWIVDTTVPARPELVVPDPDEPQWFDR